MLPLVTPVLLHGLHGPVTQTGTKQLKFTAVTEPLITQ